MSENVTVSDRKVEYRDEYGEHAVLEWYTGSHAVYMEIHEDDCGEHSVAMTIEEAEDFFSESLALVRRCKAAREEGGGA